MTRTTQPRPSEGRDLYPNASPEALAWVVEKCRGIVGESAGRAAGWEWIDPAEGEPDPENRGPAARVFDVAGGTIAAVTEGD